MLTPKQIAERAQLSLSLVYGLLNSGKLVGFRVGIRGRGKWLISEEDFTRFLDSCKTSQAVTEDESEFKWL